MKKILIGLLLGLTISACFAEKVNDFTFKNKPINPACVAMFNSSLVDYPYISAINLDNCQNSNAAYQTTFKNKDGAYYFYINNKNESEGIYSYKVIGKSENNIYVLQTQFSGGGTGSFNDLLLVELTKAKMFNFERTPNADIKETTNLVLLGTVAGGDRCIGGFSNLKIVKNTLQIKQYDGDNASDCSKQKEYAINLELQ